MPVTTDLPDPPSTLDPANFATKSDLWVAAQKLFQQELNAYAVGLSPIGRNMLINAAFRIDQRNNGASAAIADDGYCFDRWYALTQTASVASSLLADPETGYTHALRLTQSQAAAQRFGIAQIIEGRNCKHGRGNSGTLTPRIRCSASTPIRYAILGWTGTEDVVTSDVVNSWTNATFTAGQFFIGTNLSVIAVGSATPAAATWATLPQLSAALGTAFNNIIVMIWTESAQAQNVTLDFDFVQFEAGAAANPFERKPISQDLADCQRYYQAMVYNNGSRLSIGYCSNANNATGIYFSFPPMRTTPTVTVPAAGNGAGQCTVVVANGGGQPSGYGTNSGNPNSPFSFFMSAQGYTGLTAGAPAPIEPGLGGCTFTCSAEL